MQVETDEPEVIERVAALDVGKAEVVCCARVPGPGSQRMQEVRSTSTMTSELLSLGDWLADLGVTRVVMEATSDYWRAPFYLLEDRFETWLVNAHDVKHLPGRPKTDRLDAVWLCSPPAASPPSARPAGPPGSGSDRAAPEWPAGARRTGAASAARRPSCSRTR
jgi:transposase